MKKLSYYGGCGFENQKENDKYKVIIDNEIYFNSLIGALKVYDKYSGEKSIWNVRTMTLVDCWCFEL